MKSSSSIFVFLVMRMLLGVIFIAASVDKIAHPTEFAEIVQNYQILPDSLINVFAVVLPWLEAILGILILCGWWLPGATTLANLLLVVFLGALGAAVARGLDVNCGCFSTEASGQAHTLLYFGRDLILLLLGVFVMIQAFGRARKDGGKSP